ncbi:Uncharacterised protein [Mycobacteroides abscessus subsp. massiliense]|nr:Uncharacterised protein [Mycobacteroides abscessus subsp. massiliense]
MGLRHHIHFEHREQLAEFHRRALETAQDGHQLVCCLQCGSFGQQRARLFGSPDHGEATARGPYGLPGGQLSQCAATVDARQGDSVAHEAPPWIRVNARCSG